MKVNEGKNIVNNYFISQNYPSDVIKEKTCQTFKLYARLQDFHANDGSFTSDGLESMAAVGFGPAAIFSEAPLKGWNDLPDVDIDFIEEGCEGTGLTPHIRDPIDANLFSILARLIEQTDTLNQTKIGEIHSNLIEIIEHFTAEKNPIRCLPNQEQIHTLKKDTRLLDEAWLSKMSLLKGRLDAVLNLIIDQKFAIPKSGDDAIAFNTLYLLFLGTETSLSLLSFLLSGYQSLADASFQEKNIEETNRYLSLGLKTLKDFTDSLNGRQDNEGRIDQVIGLFNRVKAFQFIESQNIDTLGALAKKIERFHRVKAHLATIDSLSDVYGHKQRKQIRCAFTPSAIRTPFIGWLDGKKVSYAIQPMSRGVYFQIGDWSTPYMINQKVCPTLDIQAVSQGVSRLILRKFDDEQMEFVGLVEDGSQLKFRDVHRDLYRAASEPSETSGTRHLNLLIHDGANVTAIFERGRQAIHAATQAGSFVRVLALIRKGADINAPDKNGKAPIHIVAEWGYAHLIKDFMKHGANVNARMHSNWTALHVGAKTGDVKTIKSLLQVKEIGANAKSAKGFTPLHIALSAHHHDAVKLLSSDEKVDINAQSKQGLTPLHVAVLSESEKGVETLLSRDHIQVNLGAQGNVTALHLASIKGTILIIKRFLAHRGVEIDPKTENGWTPAHFAAKEGHLDVVDVFMEKGADFHAKNRWGETPFDSLVKRIGLKVDHRLGNTFLHDGAFKGHLQIVKHLVEVDNVDPNIKNWFEQTPLYFAALGGHLEIVKYLDTKEVDRSARDQYGKAPVHVAAAEGHLEVVNYLGNRGVDLQVKDKDGLTPVHWAAAKGRLDVVKYLDGQGVDLQVKDKDGNTPMHWAADGGHLEVMKYLEDQGIDLQVKNNNGLTPMHVAANEGRLEVVKYLDGQKVDLSVKDVYGRVPLHFAAREGRLDVVKYLDSQKVDLSVKDTDGRTPLDWAADAGHLEIVKYLDSQGVDLRVQNKDGNTPMHWAADGGYLEVMKYLEGQGIDLQVKNNNGLTPMHVAANEGRLEVVNYLDGRGVDLQIKNQNGLTPAHLAAFEGRLDVVKYLGGRGVDLSVQDVYGNTLLHFAAREGRLDVVKYLDSQKVDLSVKDTDGRTPLDWAAYAGHLEIVKYLESKRALRSHRGIETDADVSSFKGEKGRMLPSDSAFFSRAEMQNSPNQKTLRPIVHKKGEIKTGRTRKKRAHMAQSDRDLFHLSTQKKVLPQLLERRFKGNKSAVASQIGNPFEARGDWNVSMGHAAPLNHTALFLKWLGHVLGRHSFVQRMNRAEQLSDQREASETVYWAREYLNRGMQDI